MMKLKEKRKGIVSRKKLARMSLIKIIKTFSDKLTREHNKKVKYYKLNLKKF